MFHLFLISFSLSVPATAKTIKVAVFPNAQPVIFINESGRADGFFPEILNAILDKLEYKSEFIIFDSFSAAYQSVKEGNCDIMPSLIYSNERAADLDFSLNPIMISWSQVFIRPDSHLESILDLQNKSVGIITNGQNGKKFITLMEEFHIPFLREFYPSFDEASRDLLSGKIDAMISFNTYDKSNPEIKPTSMIFSPTEAYIGFTLNKHNQLRKEIDSVLIQMKKNENSPYDSIQQRWFFTKSRGVIPRWLTSLVIILAIVLGGFFLFIILLRFMIKRTETNLQKIEKKYQSVFNKSKAIMLIIDPEDGLILDANQTAISFYGYSQKQLCSMKITDVNIEENYIIKKDMRLAAENKKNFFVLNHKIASGEIKTVEVYSDPIKIENRQVLFSVIHDINEKKRLEEKSDRLEKELRRTKKLDALGIMAGGITHDIDNILGAMMGYLELIKLNVAPDKYIHYAEQAFTAGNRAKELIKQILTVSRKTEQNYVPTDLCQVIRTTLDFIERTIPDLIELHIDIPSDSVYIMGDETLLEQIIINLCNNAVFAIEKRLKKKSSPPGKITISLQLSRSGKLVQIMICDNGTGIKKSEIDNIFDPYFTTKKADEGTGLGLAMVHGIVDSHHGKIEVSSKEQTCFTVSLPVNTGINFDVKKNSRPEETQGKKKQILIVDDEEDIRFILTEVLENKNYRIETANNGLEAWLKISEGFPIDLIISDISMPQMDGLSLFKKIEESDFSIPVILMTGNITSLKVSDAIDVKPENLLTKPFSSELLLHTVNNCLKKTGDKTTNS